MKIAVKEITSISVMNEDGEFFCPHLDVEIEEPCCSGRDSDGLISCGCQGMFSVYCPDCGNKDMTQNQVDEILEGVF